MYFTKYFLDNLFIDEPWFILVCNSNCDSLLLLVRNYFLFDVSPVKPVIVEDEAGEEPEQEVDDGHHCTEHYFPSSFEVSGEIDANDDNIKDDTKQVDSQANWYRLSTCWLAEAPDKAAKKQEIGENISLKCFHCDDEKNKINLPLVPMTSSQRLSEQNVPKRQSWMSSYWYLVPSIWHPLSLPSWSLIKLVKTILFCLLYVIFVVTYFVTKTMCF